MALTRYTAAVAAFASLTIAVKLYLSSRPKRPHQPHRVVIVNPEEFEAKKKKLKEGGRGKLQVNDIPIIISFGNDETVITAFNSKSPSHLPSPIATGDK